MRDFNFFLPYLGKQEESKNKTIYIVSLVAVMAVIIVGTYFWNSYSIRSMSKDIVTIEKDIHSKGTQDKLDKAEAASKKYEVLTKYSSVLDGIYTKIDEKKGINSTLLADLFSTLPSDVSFSTVTVDGASVQVQATAKDRKSIAELEHNLKNLKEIETVHIPGISNSKDKDTENSKITYSFSIKCTLKGVNKNANK